MINLSTRRIKCYQMEASDCGKLGDASNYKTPSRAENGYAVVMTVPTNVKHQAFFLKLQREAREAGRGLWK